MMLTRLPRRETITLGLLFGSLYFIQGIGEPTEGLIAQPVRSLLKTWGETETQIATFAALLALPWSLKPLYGLMSDFIPLAGSRRRSYLILTSLFTIVPLISLWARPPEPGASWTLLAALVIPTLAVAFTDVVADALMVETSQPLGITGQMQAVQWGSMYAASILAGSLGGYLSQHHLQHLGFLICGSAGVVTLTLAVSFAKDPPVRASSSRFRETVTDLKEAATSPPLLAACAFLFLWSFNPFSTTVLYLHMTERMGISEISYGNTIALISLAAIGACVTYGLFGQRFSFRSRIHASILLGMVSTAGYWLLTDERSAQLISLTVGFAYMTATLIQFDLAARVCPPAVAGTVFATLMSLSNLSMALSTWVGGRLHESLSVAWGAHTAFNALVGIGAATTALCWLLVPWLRLSNATVEPARMESLAGNGDLKEL